MNNIPTTQELETYKEKEERFFSAILDKKLSNPNELLVHTLRMNDKQSYMAVVSSQWLANNVSTFKQLSIANNSLSGGKLVPDEENISEKKQRAIDHTRVTALGIYILKNISRTLPPLLLVNDQTWTTNFSGHFWKDGIAQKTSVSFKQLDSHGKMGVLNVDETVTPCAVADIKDEPSLINVSNE